MRSPEGRASRCAVRLLAALAMVVFGIGQAVAAPACPSGDFPSMYPDASGFEAAIASAENQQPSNQRLTGLTVPHHLVADELMARGFKVASSFAYRRIVLLAPDHFFRSGRVFATTTRGFRTALGDVPGDPAAAAALLADAALVEDSCLFSGEHGVQALLPFVRHYFPGVPVVPVAISIKAGRADWERFARLLEPLIDEDTLVVQSTDFSHYLLAHEARERDQQTLNVLAAGSLDQIAALAQPDHADSVGALYLQTALQRKRFGAAPLVIANENMQEYQAEEVRQTTSYLVILWGRFEPGFNSPLTGREQILYLAGDTLFGRNMTPLLLREEAAERIWAKVRDLTLGRPLVVNLEGVVVPDVPAGIGPMTLVMPEELTIDWLRKLNVVAVGLANNHARDLGGTGLAETRRALAAAGIPAFNQGEAVQVAGVDLVGLTDLGTNGTDEVALITPQMLDRLVRPEARRPVVAYVHWGDEYAAAPGDRERRLAGEMRLRGVAAIVGAHPHVASKGLAAAAGGDTIEAYSLGNFLFDQPSSRSSGALLELRVFRQGTVFARQIPLPNLFEAGRN